MLSAPGFRFHRILHLSFSWLWGLPFQLSDGCSNTPFLYCGFLVLVIYFIFITVLFFFVFIIMRVPLHPLGPPGGFLCLGDARRDL